MLEHMLANRKIERNQCNIKNAKTELKSAIGINSGIEIWDWNEMLKSHNKLHLKWHAGSNMSVRRRNVQQTWIPKWPCLKFHTSLPDSDVPDPLTKPKSENEGQSHGNEQRQSS